MVFCEHPQQPPVLLFGLGLIGSAVARQLKQRAGYMLRGVPQNWESPKQLEQGLNDATITLRQRAIHTQRIHVVWSAGRAGFQSGVSACDQEMDNFKRVVDWCRTQITEGEYVQRRFLLISSAGGLFEGHRCVSTTTPPVPGRPYGWLKWHQEQYICRTLKAWDVGIYRPTSVYGPSGRGHRRGLISTLVVNGLTGTETVIQGAMHTLRDFVWVEDVARFITAELMLPVRRTLAGPAILSASKPCALYEVSRLVEQILQHPLKVRFDPRRSNSTDMSFLPTTNPQGWRTSPMEAAVYQIYRDTLQKGVRRGYLALQQAGVQVRTPN